MKKVFFVSIFLLACYVQTYCQRALRRPRPISAFTSSVPFSGRLFDVTLTNGGNDSILLRLGAGKKIHGDDTLDLIRTSHCNTSEAGEHYDLDVGPDEVISCVSWYTLQLLKPGDTLHFMVKLENFDQADTARLYFFYTKSFTKSDREVEYYYDPKKIYIMKEERKLLSSFVVAEKNEAKIALRVSRIGQ
jgi:hypothetical protein